MAEAFEGWAILELMGHRRLGGYVREVSMFGATMCRIDVPAPPGGGSDATQFYGGSAIFCCTPTSEDTARRVAATAQPAPVQQWELPKLPSHGSSVEHGPYDDGAPEDD
jgi:hypothetical protein